MAKSLAGVEYDVYSENYRTQELNKALQSFTLMLLVQLGINNTRDVWKFCQIGLAPAARPILAKFANITRTINP